MKKTGVLLVAVFFLTIALAFTLSSCAENDTNGIPTFSTTSGISGNTENSGISDKVNNTDKENNNTDVQQPDHDHIYEITVLAEPSCGKEGKQAYKCVICGKQQHETSIAPLASQHNYHYSTELSIVPTCTTAGKKVELCHTCGQVKEEFWAATGHKWYTKAICGSTSNELYITPYCTQCPLISQHIYRYNINDVTKLVSGSYNIFGELDYTIIGSMGNATILKAPYYAVYCSDTYLLIARSTKSIACYEPNGSVINDSPLNYYKNRGCQILLESTITIDKDGRIQIVN